MNVISFLRKCTAFSFDFCSIHNKQITNVHTWISSNKTWPFRNVSRFKLNIFKTEMNHNFKIIPILMVMCPVLQYLNVSYILILHSFTHRTICQRLISYHQDRSNYNQSFALKTIPCIISDTFRWKLLHMTFFSALLSLTISKNVQA